MAKKKTARVLKLASERLKVPGFLQCSIQVVAVVPVPGSSTDAKDFVAERLMGGADQASELGPDYFGGSIRFRRLRDDGTGEDALVIEPFFQDTSLVFLNHQVARVAIDQPLTDLDQVGTWIEEAFDFLSGPTMRLLNK